MGSTASMLDSYNGNVVRMIKEKYPKLAKDPLVKHLMSEMEKMRKQLITIVVEQEKVA